MDESSSPMIDDKTLRIMITRTQCVWILHSKTRQYHGDEWDEKGVGVVMRFAPEMKSPPPPPAGVTTVGKSIITRTNARH